MNQKSITEFAKKFWKLQSKFWVAFQTCEHNFAPWIDWANIYQVCSHGSEDPHGCEQIFVMIFAIPMKLTTLIYKSLKQ